MGVYIKGMEMPKTHPLTVTIYPDGQVLSETVGAKDVHGTAVPVPPHGRLIDADEMKKSIRKQTAILRLIGGEFAEIAETLEKGFLQEIDNAPTIIPTEEG